MKFYKTFICQSVLQLFVILLCLANFNGVRSECNSSNEWQCDDGACIPDDRLCDGKVDCTDRSDEIAENCIQYRDTCQNLEFRCTYGACIEGKAKCNGVQECADNSDELICVKKDNSDFQGICPDTEIQCVKSKECINSIHLCDGRVHCKDGSDESPELCIHFGCISFGFQCGYGACISGKSKCNGIIDCADGSDEAWELCNTPRKKNNLIGVVPTSTPLPPTTTITTVPVEFSRCIIPNIPQLQNLVFRIHPQNETIAIGSFAENYDIIHIECRNNYTLKGQPNLICKNGEWNSDFPTCDGYCDGTILNRLSIRAICRFRTRYTECPTRIRPGTSIQVSCAFGYTRTPNVREDLSCLPDGSFDKSPTLCKQICGKIAPNSEVLSKDGIPIDISLAPWHVSIYENNSVIYNYICSGSIVSPRVVISAAHCFWDEPNLILKNYIDYKIIAGRSTSNYTTVENEYSRIITVQEIHIPIDYLGIEGRQRGDIAFVKLATPLKYSETIAPICIPAELVNTGSTYVLSNKKGFINSFGIQNQLERLKMITLAYHDCIERSPQDAPVADDKFCIYNNEGSSLCRGDSGGGFYTETTNAETNEIIYRLSGVISNTPTTRNDCTRMDEKSYIAITNIISSDSEFNRKLAHVKKEDEEML